MSISSAAVTLKLTAAPFESVASSVIGSGTVICGSPLSKTITSNMPIAVFPPRSVAVQLTFVVPSANVLPELGVQTISVVVLSSAETSSEVKMTIAPAELSASTGGKGAGTEIVGGIKSTMEIVIPAMD